jgi:hypothetical protein
VIALIATDLAALVSRDYRRFSTGEAEEVTSVDS